MRVEPVPAKRRLRIAYSLPVFKPPDTSDSSYIHQMLVMQGLRARGHALTMIAPTSLTDVICAVDLDAPRLVARTFSQAGWFKLASKASWRVQQSLGVPYLNYFSNYCLYDAAMQCLPGFDLVQERNGLYKMGVAMACERLHLPYILFFDADDILEHDLFGKPLAGALRWRAAQTIRHNLAFAVRVICVSESAKKHLISTWRVGEEKIAVFPNGVDIGRFRPDAESRALVRARFKIGDNPMVIFVGSFFPYQDVTVLLDAFARTLREFPLAKLLLVGEGELYQRMVQYSRDIGLDEAVHFTGFVPQAEIPSLINAADVAVAPYAKMKDEQFLGSSMKILEYMACGSAVIASDIGQIREVIHDGGNGLLVAPGDAEALASALLRLIGDHELGLRLGRRAREDTVQKYSWEHYILRLEELYSEILRS